MSDPANRIVLKPDNPDLPGVTFDVDPENSTVVVTVGETALPPLTAAQFACLIAAGTVMIKRAEEARAAPEPPAKDGETDAPA